MHRARRIAIIWPGAHHMAHSSSSDFKIALAVLADTADVLADPGATCGNPKEIAILVELASPFDEPRC